MRRGDIFKLNLPKGSGHEQSGTRYGVVLQSDAFLPRSTVIIAPTSRSAIAATFRPDIKIGKQSSKVLVEQAGAVDTSRLGRKTGQVSIAESWAIDDALRLVLDLP